MLYVLSPEVGTNGEVLFSVFIKFELVVLESLFDGVVVGWKSGGGVRRLYACVGGCCRCLTCCGCSVWLSLVDVSAFEICSRSKLDFMVASSCSFVVGGFCGGWKSGGER